MYILDRVVLAAVGYICGYPGITYTGRGCTPAEYTPQTPHLYCITASLHYSFVVSVKIMFSYTCSPQTSSQYVSHICRVFNSKWQYLLSNGGFWLILFTHADFPKCCQNPTAATFIHFCLSASTGVHKHPPASSCINLQSLSSTFVHLHSPTSTCDILEVYNAVHICIALPETCCRYKNWEKRNFL